MIVREATASVQRKVVHNLTKRTLLSQPKTNEVLGVHQFITTPSVIEVRATRVINMGDYESFHLSIGLSLPCYSEKRSEAFEDAYGWLAASLDKEIATLFPER